MSSLLISCFVFIRPLVRGSLFQNGSVDSANAIREGWKLTLERNPHQSFHTFEVSKMWAGGETIDDTLKIIQNIRPTRTTHCFTLVRQMESFTTPIEKVSFCLGSRTCIGPKIYPLTKLYQINCDIITIPQAIVGLLDRWHTIVGESNKVYISLYILNQVILRHWWLRIMILYSESKYSSFKNIIERKNQNQFVLTFTSTICSHTEKQVEQQLGSSPRLSFEVGLLYVLMARMH